MQTQTPIDHDALYEALDATREQLLELLATVSDSFLLRPGTLGEWSVRDLLFHITIWEAELVTALLKIDQGKKPDGLLAAMANRDAFNAARLAENQNRDLDRIFDDLQGTRYQLEEWLETFSKRDLQDKHRYSWAKGKPLWQIIAINSFEHEAQHLAELQKLVENADEPQIGLDTIEIIDLE